MKDWCAVADEKSIKTTVEALKKNGIEAQVVGDGNEAKKKVLEILPKGAEVMNMTSVTLETISLAKEILESDNYNSVRAKLISMDRTTQSLEMQKLGAALAWENYFVAELELTLRDNTKRLIKGLFSRKQMLEIQNAIDEMKS